MRVISVHVPKTAGLSLQKHLKAIFGESRTYLDYNHCDRPDKTPPQTPPPYVLAQFRKTHKTTCVHGHFLLSKYRHIPAASRMMWFRDPVERLLSHYYYWLRAPDMGHPHCKALHEQGLSVAEFAQLPELVNFHARFLDGESVDSLDFIGLVEDYPASLNLMYIYYGINKDPRQVEVHDNRNFARGSQDQYTVTDEVRRQVAEINAQDMAIYEQAKERFEVMRVRFGSGY